MLIELDVPFKLELTQIEQGTHKSKEYLAINPKGRVPTLVVDGKPVTECTAILMLLAERHPEAKFAPAAGSELRGEWLEMMVYLANALLPPMRDWFYAAKDGTTTTPRNEHDAAVISSLARYRIEEAFAILEQRLSDKRAYMLGDQLTTVDLLATMVMRWSRNMPNPATSHPNISAYVQQRMKIIKSSKSVKVPAGVTVTVQARLVKVVGPRGTLKKDFGHMSVDINMAGKKEKMVVIDLWFGERREIASITTVASHIENMITGVTKGFEYKMRFVYAHFPINVAVVDNGKIVEIRNFFGEKIVRRIPLLDGITCTRNEKVKDEIVLIGNDLELLSQSCANIQLKSAVKFKDVRKFLDGIYVSERNVIGEN
eukprot:gene13879-16370_t